MLEKKPPQQVAGHRCPFHQRIDSAPTRSCIPSHYKVLHEKNVILSLKISNTPRVPTRSACASAGR
jgi:K+ transporter